MANYNTITKIIKWTKPYGTETSATADSFAEAINNYVQTLDTSTGEIISVTISNGIAVIIHKG